MDSVQCERCGFFLYVSLKGTGARRRIAPEATGGNRVAAEFGRKEGPGFFGGRVVRVALRMDLRSAAYAKKIRSVVRGFQGVTEVHSWGGTQGLVVVGRLDPGLLRAWLEELVADPAKEETGCSVRLILVSYSSPLAGGESEVFLQTKLQSNAGMQELRRTILGFEGVREVSARLLRDQDGTHLFRVQGTMDYAKLSSYIEQVWTQSMKFSTRGASRSNSGGDDDGRQANVKTMTGGKKKGNAGDGMEENALPLDNIYLS